MLPLSAQVPHENPHVSPNEVLEVDSFPIDDIRTGATYTFTPQTALRATQYSHGLHVYPAKFIPQIPNWAIKYARLGIGSVVLDPFCGSGTTLVEAAVAGYDSYGVDINPLARLLTQVKATPLHTTDPLRLQQDVDALIDGVAKSRASDDDIIAAHQRRLHPNWEFWFPRPIMARFLQVRDAIDTFESQSSHLTEQQLTTLRRFFLACLSSVVKKSSMFDEREIKVRKDTGKSAANLVDPGEALRQAAKKNIPGMIDLTNALAAHGFPKAEVIGEYSQKIPHPDQSVDLIVTSPPYINAIDYAMAHKYSLFILDFVLPEEFKDHCREYIGVTERAVRPQEYNGHTTPVGNVVVDEHIRKLAASPSSVDRIRAYIMSDYFKGMRKSLEEAHRLLRPGGLLIIMVGDNIIRRSYVPTSEIVQEIAVEQCNFNLENYFFHQLRNIRLKVSRNVTGGKIKAERVIILRK